MLSRSKSDLGKPQADDHTDGLIAKVGGYYYYFTHPQNPCSQNQAAQTEQNREESVLIKQLKNLQPLEFDIPQLGIKMSLPGDLAGLTYNTNPNHTGTANRTYTFTSTVFTTQYLEQHGCYTGNYTAESGVPFDAQVGIGMITRYTVDPKTLGIGGIGPVRKVGDFWMEYQGPQAACGDNATVNANQNSSNQLLFQAFNSATALP